MPFSAQSIQERPYNMCLNCVHIGKNCDGPNFLAMGIDLLSDWCRMRKDYLHSLDPKWTNAYIAEQAGISKVSVDRFLAGYAIDLKASTLSSILKVLVNGTWGKYPCAMGDFIDKKIIYKDDPVLVSKIAMLEEEKQRLELNLKAMQEEYRLDTAILAQREKDRTTDLRNRVKFQEEQILQKDRMINFLMWELENGHKQNND